MKQNFGKNLKKNNVEENGLAYLGINEHKLFRTIEIYIDKKN